MYADPDPDPAAQINADPCGSGYGSETLGLIIGCVKVEAVDLEDIEFTSQRFQLSEDARTPKYL